MKYWNLRINNEDERYVLSHYFNREISEYILYVNSDGQLFEVGEGIGGDKYDNNITFNYFYNNIYLPSIQIKDYSYLLKLLKNIK